jgi:hypothetical protein
MRILLIKKDKNVYINLLIYKKEILKKYVTWDN